MAGFGRIGLRIVSGITTRRDRRGLLITGRRNEPYWAGPFTTDRLDPDMWSIVTAFLDNCVDRNLRVDFVHPRRAIPRAYTMGSWPLVADPIVTAVTHGRQIVASGLQVGMTLKRGDRLTIMQGDLRCYRRLENDLVVASAVSQALPISPRIPLGVFTPGAAVRFKNPPVRLAIVPDSYPQDEVYEQTAITFETEEALA